MNVDWNLENTKSWASFKIFRKGTKKKINDEKKKEPVFSTI